MSLVDDVKQNVLDSTVEFKGDGRNASCEFKSAERITTVEQVFDKSGVDPKLWRIKDFTCKAWQVGMKLKGRDDSYYPHTENLWAVSVRFERIHPPGLVDALDLLKGWNPPRPIVPKTPRAKTRDKHLLELDLFDAHFGKYAWYEETGTDYDTEIASRLFAEAVGDLLLKSGGYNVRQFLIPIGNDFFQADNWTETTTKGTKVDHDTRFPRVFEMGFKAIVDAVNSCLNVAPVKLIYVPGNHDQATSWYLCHSLSSWFNKCKHVEVDAGPKQRKYETFGNTLLGFNHGDKVKMDQLPLTMATEVPDLFGASTHREIHIGHFHKQKTKNILTLDETNGIRVRVLSSLSGTDAWHYGQGYTKGVRAAECYLWSEDEGLSGQFYSNVKEGR